MTFQIPPERQPVGVVTTGPNHGLHFALTLFTCGLWLPVWVLIGLFNPREVYTVDIYGNKIVPPRQPNTPAYNIVVVGASVILALFVILAIVGALTS